MSLGMGSDIGDGTLCWIRRVVRIRIEVRWKLTLTWPRHAVCISSARWLCTSRWHSTRWSSVNRSTCTAEGGALGRGYGLGVGLGVGLGLGLSTLCRKTSKTIVGLMRWATAMVACSLESAS